MAVLSSLYSVTQEPEAHRIWVLLKKAGRARHHAVTRSASLRAPGRDLSLRLSSGLELPYASSWPPSHSKAGHCRGLAAVSAVETVRCSPPGEVALPHSARGRAAHLPGLPFVVLGAVNRSSTIEGGDWVIT